MDERTRILVANERTKAISSVIVNLGTALVAAAFAKWWADGAFGLAVLIWLVAGATGITAATHMLGRLEAEL